MRKILNLGLLAVALLAPLSALAGPVNVITNGGFENGLSGWTASATNPSTGGCDTSWNVGTSGSATGCSGYAPYNGFVNPYQGTKAAYNSFDGDGPQTFSLTQSFVVPSSVSSAILSWVDAVAFGSGPSYNFPLARTFSVKLAVGGQTFDLFNESFKMTGNGLFRNWTSFSIDLTSILDDFVNQTAKLTFSNYIPNSYSGPGSFGLDNVALNVTRVPEPESLSLLLLGLGMIAWTLRRSRR